MTPLLPQRENQSSLPTEVHLEGVPAHRSGLAGVDVRAEPQRHPGGRDGPGKDDPGLATN